jgi:hypothetical protein
LVRTEIVERETTSQRSTLPAQALSPLRPLNALPVMAAAFESDERVEFIDRLYRQSPDEERSFTLATRLAPAANGDEQAAPSAARPEAEQASAPGHTSLFYAVTAAGLLLLGSCAWAWRWRAGRGQGEPRSGGPMSTKGAQ